MFICSLTMVILMGELHRSVIWATQISALAILLAGVLSLQKLHPSIKIQRHQQEVSRHGAIFGQKIFFRFLVRED